VDPFTVETTISVPPERVVEYLSDVANHAEFSDHYLTDWHLLREEPRGVGAGARFRIKAPLNRFAWGDFTIAEVTPQRIMLRGRSGKYNRTRMIAVYALSPWASGSTRVQYTFETDPPLLSDRLVEALGARSRTRRQAAKAMRRLRGILEEGVGRGTRPTVAAR
jgi:uncharacterized protein YndB with AHSA1/START domain